MAARVSDLPGPSLQLVSSSRALNFQQGFVYGTTELNSAYLIMKRLIDVLTAVVLLLMLWPIMALITLVILLDGGGPVLYRQNRVGYRGRQFVMLKFRTMVTQSHAIPVPIKRDRDPRITRIGRFLRKMSLDELPQLWNVLRGDMSLVGPRPELVEMLQYYRPEHYLRHRAMPGLTGWWQVNGRCRRRLGCSPDEDLQLKLADDLEYFQRRSFLFDLQLLIKTVPVVITGRGAA